MGSLAQSSPMMRMNGGTDDLEGAVKKKEKCSYFQMPLHYPRYTKTDYEKMPEWKLDCLLTEYGLPVTGNLDQKRKFAMGAFLWHY